MSKGHGEGNPSDLTDAALLRRLGMQDAAAFRVLVERHGAVPHRVALRILGSASDAEDVMQETLLRLWRLASRAADITSPAAWLCRVATNLCFDRLRSPLNTPHHDLETADLADGAPLADARIEEMERQGAAQRAIACLPDRQRAAIVLTYYEGMANAAAAETLEMNIKAFESLLLRARNALRSNLHSQLAGSLERSAHDRA